MVGVGLALTTPVAAQAGRFITGGDIKNGSVTTADVANGTLKRRDLARGALPAQGPKGPQGEPGPSGVVAAKHQSGAVDAPTSTWAFLAAPASVTVRSGETVSVTSAVALGSTEGAVDLDLDICFSDGESLSQVPGGGVNNLAAPGGGQRLLFTLPAIIDGLAGTYAVGMCGKSDHAGDWDLEGGGQTSVQVFRVSP